VIAFGGAFHGRTVGSLSIGASKAVHRRGFGPLLAGVHHLPYDCPRSAFEELFASTAPADEVAAIFVEPLQGEGGYRVPSAGFLPMLRELCDQHGMLLVADEVQSGIGRTGKFLACEHFGVAPDIVCLAKGLASGLPLGAIVSRAEVMSWPPGAHASTFGGNPVACRAALATLRLVEREYQANAAARGQQLAAGLATLATEIPWLANPRGLGLMQAIDVLDDQGILSPRRRAALIQACFERGLLLLGCGKAAIRFCPGLCVSEDEVETALDLLRAGARSTEGTY
jgi:4-aminobutyrate aminotransferase